MNKRGIPSYGDPVHMIKQDDHNMICHNGSYHVFYTRNKKEVTCSVCLKKLKGVQQ